jgi:hypothetical protein
MYCETLQKRVGPFRTEGSGILTSRVILLHDNARPHTRVLLGHFCWELFDHLFPWHHSASAIMRSYKTYSPIRQCLNSGLDYVEKQLKYVQ